MEQTNLNIGTIGQRLEAARQSKGVSASEAGQATKILSRFIEAMEADDFGALSAPVYARSFIKMYATYLGMDASPLVDEYAEQHAPKTQRQLSEEVRQNIAGVDQISAESPTPPAPPAGEGQKIFGPVNEAITKLSGNRLSPKTIAIASGGLVGLLILVLSVSQCDAEDEDAPASAAGGAALSADRELLVDAPPDSYLVKPGKIEVGD
jgi:hypothetical protein